ncbi:MAG: SusF/SusE family outer membrane protein [Bacteroidales bacterium]|jgi:hypothetical protein|nr:SusF/SusE family outer membrane protein [Bacteroidales bacterium]
MKKFLSIISAGLLLVSAGSCVKDDLATFDPSKATAPVLGSYDVSEKAITATYTPGTFKMGFNEKMAPYHSLVIVSSDGKPVNKVLPSTANDGNAKITVTALSKALVNLGCSFGQNVDVELAIRASMQDPARDNGRNGYVDSKGRILVKGFTIVEAAGNPFEGFDQTSTWSVTGSIASANINWDKDIAMVSDGTWHVAKSVVLTSADQFKFRKDGGWDNNIGATGDVEPFVVTLDTELEGVDKGKNLSVSADGAYDLWVNPDAKLYKVTEAYNPYPDFNQESSWGLTGALTEYGIEWNGDIAASTNGSDAYLVQGVNLKKDNLFKFRKDQDWAVNRGAAGDADPTVVALDAAIPSVQDGKNMAVAEDGVYDIILDNAAGTITVVATMGGPASKKIGSEDPEEPDKPAVWSLIGTIGGSNWDTDTDLTNIDGDIWIVRNVVLTDSDEFKIRADHKWEESYGGPEENATSTIDPANAYGVYKPTLGTVFEAKDKNIAVGAAGKYDVTFDYAAKTILVEEHVAAYSLIGEINGDSWTKDVVMSRNGDVWTSPVVNITGGFKIRFDYSWDAANTYGAPEGFTPVIGEAFTAVQPGGNISVPEGDYKVTFNAQDLSVTITAVAFPEQLHMIGEEFGSWDWTSSGVVDLVPVNGGEGQFWTVRYFSAGKGFKFCAKKDWQGDFWGLKTNEGFTEVSGNCTVAADGFYMVHIDLKREIVHVEPARIYGMGDCFGGWDAEKETALFQADGKTLKATLSGSGELRMFAASSIANTDWWTREFIILDGKIAYRGTGGDQERVPCTAGQVVTLDFNAGTGTIQ